MFQWKDQKVLPSIIFLSIILKNLFQSWRWCIALHLPKWQLKNIEFLSPWNRNQRVQTRITLFLLNFSFHFTCTNSYSNSSFLYTKNIILFNYCFLKINVVRIAFLIFSKINLIFHTILLFFLVQKCFGSWCFYFVWSAPTL